MQTVLRVDPVIGRVYVPEALKKLISLPNSPTRRAINGEIGIFVATQQRPIFSDEGHLLRWETVWASVSHNERVDRGSSIQANRAFGTVGTAANGVFSAMAIASASISKTKTDLSLGTISSGVTTNEYTTIGLSRAAATIQNLTTPSTLGGTFSVDAYKSFTLSGGGTAYGAGLFDQVVVASSNLYCEDLFASTAVLISGDTLNVTVTVTN